MFTLIVGGDGGVGGDGSRDGGGSGRVGGDEGDGDAGGEDAWGSGAVGRDNGGGGVACRSAACFSIFSDAIRISLGVVDDGVTTSSFLGTYRGELSLLL